ncbi:hypothetical protein J5226_11380 [Lysobacter sp. K5869]|uniref:hypothetical protein n=1 Tax=Lysobacter sp. K5869 TaxID=2820808 RepID=UPI001C060557|nr:hypothetical protein [Lysobacter sp. K5869]QWP78944.1 hypothetical protein J5226_11380 [Lysobacter sp. K5869]
MNDRNVALDFFEYWKTTGMVDSKFFSEDFVYIGSAKRVDSETWMANSDVELPIENAVILETIVSGASTIILFDGVEPITMLNYRTAWFFLIREEKIARLTEVRAIADPR